MYFGEMGTWFMDVCLFCMQESAKAALKMKDCQMTDRTTQTEHTGSEVRCSQTTQSPCQTEMHNHTSFLYTWLSIYATKICVKIRQFSFKKSSNCFFEGNWILTPFSLSIFSRVSSVLLCLKVFLHFIVRYQLLPIFLQSPRVLTTSAVSFLPA